MQVDTRWAQPVVSDLASVPIENNHNKQDFEQRLSVRSLQQTLIQPPVVTPPPTTTNFFPPQRVEPIDMARSHQSTLQNRTKAGYIQSATTDEQQTLTILSMQNRPIKRVQHPADRSTIVIFLQRISTLIFAIFISLPCVILLTLVLPVCWLVRTFIRLTCRHHCTVTPCACSYLSASDLFWFYNSNLSKTRDKNDEPRKFNCRTISPIGAAVFFLEGKIKRQL